MKYRKKPILLDAIKVSPEVFRPEYQRPAQLQDLTFDPVAEQIIVPTMEAAMLANIGDWIVTNANGDHFVCRDDIFTSTYEPVEDSSSNS